jgi:sarcosine oxidase subunit beta
MKLQDTLNQNNLPTKSDVVIIGGGIIGCSIAMFLSTKGVNSITLIEMNSLSSGATHKSGAMIREFYQTDFLIEMAKESKKLFEKTEIKINKNGRLYLFSKENKEIVEQNVKLNQDHGVNLEILSTEQIEKLIPNINLSNVEIGFLEPNAGYVDSVDSTYYFANEALNNGVGIFTHTKVESIEVKNDKIKSVTTDKGKIETSIVVNAAGAWANYINKSTNENLPIFALRVQQALVKSNSYFDPFKYCLMDYVNGTYMRPDDGNSYIIGEELGFEQSDIVSPDFYNQSADENIILNHKLKIENRLPRFKDSILKGGHAALYDMTPDANPILGKSTKIKGLFYAVGFSGHGFKLSPIIGKLLSELIVENIKDPLLDKFNLTRFTIKNLIKPKFPFKNMLN